MNVMAYFILPLAGLLSSHVFAGNKFPGQCADVCNGNALNPKTRAELWQIVRETAALESGGKVRADQVIRLTPASLSFVIPGGLDASMLKIETAIRTADKDPCYLVTKAGIDQAAALQNKSGFHTAATMFYALLEVFAGNRCN